METDIEKLWGALAIADRRVEQARGQYSVRPDSDESEVERTRLALAVAEANHKQAQARSAIREHFRREFAE